MTIMTHCTERKDLVKKLADHLGLEAHYNGMPSCSYTVGDFTIDRDAAITCENDAGLVALKPWLEANGYIAPEIPEGIQEMDGTQLAVTFPCDSLTPNMLKNLVFMFYSKQTLINQSTGNGALRISDALVDQLKAAELAALADFETLMQGFHDSGDVGGIDFKDGQVTIDYGTVPDPDELNAYLVLTQQILKAAKEATRVFPEHIQSDNTKYYMRSWLVRLGMGGPEHKGVRHCLLKNLKGHSAFRSDVEAQKHRDKYAAIRREKREAAKAKEAAE